MSKLRFFRLPLFISVTALLMTACGGGGGGSTIAGTGSSTGTGSGAGTTTSSSYTISGTVPGTLVEAFCNDGSYFKTTSTKNGTERHPYSLVLPDDVICHLVMTTNEDSSDAYVVTPIKFSDQTLNSIAFTGNDTDIDLGHTSLALQRSDMKSDANNDGVEDEPLLIAANGLKIANLLNDPMDSDRDDIIDIYEDDDSDGQPNKYDDDDDDDSIKDADDYDDDNDGNSDNDLDNDGISDDDDLDDDNDGIPDTDDSDDDNDGIPDDEDDDDDNDGKKDDDDDDANNTTPPAASVEGRLLASQCAQCHGTDGYSKTEIDSLAGESVGEIVEEMQEMKASNENDIMHFQARGYTDEQIRLIANFFANQTRSNKGDD